MMVNSLCNNAVMTKLEDKTWKMQGDSTEVRKQRIENVKFDLWIVLRRLRLLLLRCEPSCRLLSGKECSNEHLVIAKLAELFIHWLCLSSLSDRVCLRFWSQAYECSLRHRRIRGQTNSTNFFLTLSKSQFYLFTACETVIHAWSRNSSTCHASSACQGFPCNSRLFADLFEFLL